MRSYFSAAILFSSFTCLSQTLFENIGARQSALGGASTLTSDSYSLINNIGALSFAEKTGAFSGYQNRFGIRELQTFYGGVATNVNDIYGGIGLVRFGGDLFNRQQVTVGISNSFQLVSLGLSLSLVQFRIQDLASAQGLLVNFGGLVKLLPQFSIAGHISNISQSRLDRESSERFPTRMKIGFAYEPSSEIRLNLQVDKDLDLPEVIQLGLEYDIIEPITIRTGLSSRPTVLAFGFGAEFLNFQFDYAFKQSSPLGAIHEFSLQRYFWE